MTRYEIINTGIALLALVIGGALAIKDYLEWASQRPKLDIRHVDAGADIYGPDYVMYWRVFTVTNISEVPAVIHKAILDCDHSHGGRCSGHEFVHEQEIDFWGNFETPLVMPAWSTTQISVLVATKLEEVFKDASISVVDYIDTRPGIPAENKSVPAREFPVLELAARIVALKRAPQKQEAGVDEILDDFVRGNHAFGARTSYPPRVVPCDHYDEEKVVWQCINLKLQTSDDEMFSSPPRATGVFMSSWSQDVLQDMWR